MKLRPVHVIAWGAVLLLTATVCWAGKQFVMPPVQPAKTYSAHDEHANESATVAADAYDSADKARIFSVHYNDIGLLPVLLVVTNDGDQPISLADMKAELITSDRSKLLAAVPDDIYRRISHPHPSQGAAYPLPFPTKKCKRRDEWRDSRRNSELPICRQGRGAAQHAVGIFIFRRGWNFFAGKPGSSLHYGCSQRKRQPS